MGPDGGSQEEKILFLYTCTKLEQIQLKAQSVSCATANRHKPMWSTEAQSWEKEYLQISTCSRSYQQEHALGAAAP